MRKESLEESCGKSEVGGVRQHVFYHSIVPRPLSEFSHPHESAFCCALLVGFPPNMVSPPPPPLHYLWHVHNMLYSIIPVTIISSSIVIVDVLGNGTNSTHVLLALSRLGKMLPQANAVTSTDKTCYFWWFRWKTANFSGENWCGGDIKGLQRKDICVSLLTKYFKWFSSNIVHIHTSLKSQSKYMYLPKVTTL